MTVYPKRLTLSITEGDIEDGERRQAMYCPFALATTRETMSVCVVATPNYIALFDIKNEPEAYYKMTKKATTWMERFDLGRHVKPDKFQLIRSE